MFVSWLATHQCKKIIENCNFVSAEAQNIGKAVCFRANFELIFLIFTYLIQFEEKTHVPLTVRLPDNAFNEIYVCIVFTIGMFSWYTIFIINTRIKEHVSFESWEKKKLLLARFLVKFVMLPEWSIELANRLVCVPVCISTIVKVSLTSLKLLKCKVQ